MLIVSIIFLIFTLVVLIFAVSIIVGLIMGEGVPFISTPKKNFDLILKSADLKPGQVMYDLGCGRANLLIKAAKEYQVKGIGYEISLWPYVWGRYNVWRHKAKVKIFLQSFLKADLSQADVVFCYLFAEIMEKLEPKFKKELKPGAKVVSYAFAIKDRKPDEIIQTQGDDSEIGKIFVYQY